MDDRQLIADLLSALEYHTEQTRPIEFSKVAIEAAREYLRKPAQQMNLEIKKMYEDYFDKCFRSQPKQEPVAWAMLHDNGHFIDAIHPDEHARVEGKYIHPLYTTAQRTWVGLTDDEILLISAECAASHQHTDIHFARAIEAAHGIKEQT